VRKPVIINVAASSSCDDQPCQFLADQSTAMAGEVLVPLLPSTMQENHAGSDGFLVDQPGRALHRGD
jgi:chloramphenicol O-acetyltransferase